MKPKKKPIPFDRKLSLALDRAIEQKEQGKTVGAMKKRYIEWLIFGGKR